MHTIARSLCIVLVLVHGTGVAQTQPGKDPRRRVNAEARTLLARADTLAETGDFAGALTAYMQAVNVDPAAADLDTIDRYSTWGGTEEQRQALRQYLALRPDNFEATQRLLSVAGEGEADALIAQAVRQRPKDPQVYATRAMMNARFGRLAAALDDWKKASELDPANPEWHYLMGVATWEALKAPEGLTDEQRREKIGRALASLDRAEALRADYFEALTYRSLLLRQQAALETNPATSKKLIAAADAARERAKEIVKKRRPAAAPTPEPEPQAEAQQGATGPYRVGDDVKAPVLMERVEPEYPELARKARISGIVIAELLIDKTGRVQEARVLKGLPFGLDEAALAAVKQWSFRPGTLDGNPVDVLFNVTVSFRPPAE